MLAAMASALIDTHCHLYLGDLEAQADAAWGRARSNGVVQAVVPAVDVASSEAVVPFVAARDGLFAAVGVHPNETALAAGDWRERIAALVARPKVVALGETGLDCFRERAPLAVQQASLVQHCEMALAHDLPVILHVRQAFPPLRETLAPLAAQGLRAVLHCFDGGPAELHPFVEWGFYVSFSGILTYPKRDDLRAAAAEVPHERLLVETDAPFLAPVPKRGTTNEPAFVHFTAQKLAECCKLPFEELAAVTTENARRLFRLPIPPH
jgi:TatD DNase family protein